MARYGRKKQGGDPWQIISVTPVIDTMTIHTTTAIPMEWLRV
jgi:hypothetical protein